MKNEQERTKERKERKNYLAKKKNDAVMRIMNILNEFEEDFDENIYAGECQSKVLQAVERLYL